MNSSNRQELEQKLQDLEREVNQGANPPQTSVSPEEKFRPNDPNPDESNLDRVVNALKNGFNALPPVGKVLVSLFAAVFVFSILSGIFRLLTSLLMLAIIGTVGYCVYQWFIVDKKD